MGFAEPLASHVGAVRPHADGWAHYQTLRYAADYDCRWKKL